jgi:hypothetical protein
MIAGFGAFVSVVACGSEEQLRETSALSGPWAGRWTAIGLFIRTPQRASPLELEFEAAQVVSGRLRDAPFELLDRSELFDGRRNGRVYDEGEGLFRTSLALEDRTAYELGFMLDSSGDRAVVANFGLQIGVLQRVETIPDPEVVAAVTGSWTGRMITFDLDNVDEATATHDAVTLDCTEASCRGTRGTASFSLALTEVGGGAWSATVSGFSPGDADTRVRAVVGPDGGFLALSLCAVDPRVAGFDCAYAAIERAAS